MAILEQEITSTRDLARRVFTREEYYKMAEAGLFDDEKVELIEGDIISVPPPGPSHRTTSIRLFKILDALFANDHYVMHESPIDLANITEPIPDVSVATGSEADYFDRHPDYSDICLAVEISDSSLYKDRKLKQRLYAGKGIAEYWIVNLVAKQLEVYREPTAEGYGPPAICLPGDTVETLFAPGIPIAISDFLRA
jgi:Uma2 family endonuclease